MGSHPLPHPSTIFWQNIHKKSSSWSSSRSGKQTAKTIWDIWIFYLDFFQTKIWSSWLSCNSLADMIVFWQKYSLLNVFNWVWVWNYVSMKRTTILAVFAIVFLVFCLKRENKENLYNFPSEIVQFNLLGKNPYWKIYKLKFVLFEFEPECFKVRFQSRINLCQMQR